MNWLVNCSENIIWAFNAGSITIPSFVLENFVRNKGKFKFNWWVYSNIDDFGQELDLSRPAKCHDLLVKKMGDTFQYEVVGEYFRTQDNPPDMIKWNKAKGQLMIIKSF